MTYKVPYWEGDISLLAFARQLCPDEVQALERSSEVTDQAAIESSRRAIALAIGRAVVASHCELWRKRARIRVSFFQNENEAFALLEGDLSIELAGSSPSCSVRSPVKRDTENERDLDRVSTLAFDIKEAELEPRHRHFNDREEHKVNLANLRDELAQATARTETRTLPSGDFSSKDASDRGAAAPFIEPLETRAAAWLVGEMTSRILSGKPRLRHTMIIALRVKYPELGERQARKLLTSAPNNLKTKRGRKRGSRNSRQK